MFARTVALVALSAALSPVALAACPAPASNLAGPHVNIDGLNLGNDLFGVEGPVDHAEIDPSATGADALWVFGNCINVPKGTLVDVSPYQDAAHTTTLDKIANDTGHSRSYKNGTAIITGTVSYDAATNMPTFTAGSLPGEVYFEFAEQVFNGLLTRVDPPDVLGDESVNTDHDDILVGQVRVKLNPDNRLPALLLDVGFHDLDTSSPPAGKGAFYTLEGWESSVITAQGYMHNGTLYATTIETVVIPASAGTDSVVVNRADYRSSKRQVDIRGQTTPANMADPAGSVTDTVYIDIGCDAIPTDPSTIPSASRVDIGSAVIDIRRIENTQSGAAVVFDTALNLTDFQWRGTYSLPAGNKDPSTTVCTSTATACNTDVSLVGIPGSGKGTSVTKVCAYSDLGGRDTAGVGFNVAR